VRFIDEDFVVRSTILNLTSNVNKHDATFYREMLTSQLHSWELSANKIVGITTDGDSAQSAVRYY
jgi:hypothetical protein